jgi:WD40 repeat protein
MLLLLLTCGIANVVVLIFRSRRQTITDIPPRRPLRLPSLASSTPSPQIEDDHVCSIAFSLLGTNLISGSGDDKLSVWFPEIGKYGVTWRAPPRGGLTSIAFCGDNSWLATISPYRGVKFWAAGKKKDTGEKTFKEVTSNMFGSHPTCVTFKPPISDDLTSTNIAAVALADLSIRILEHDPAKRPVPKDVLALETNDPRAKKTPDLFTELVSLTGHTDQINALAFSHDGTLLASVSNDHTTRIWSTNSWQHLATLRGHSGPVTSVSFSKNGTLFATASDDTTIAVWDRNSLTQSETLKGHTDSVLNVVFCGASDWLASTSADRKIMVWPLEKNVGKAFQLAENPGNYAAIDVSANGEYFASSWGKYVKFWKTATIQSDAKRQLEIT